MSFVKIGFQKQINQHTFPSFGGVPEGRGGFLLIKIFNHFWQIPQFCQEMALYVFVENISQKKLQFNNNIYFSYKLKKAYI